MIFVAHLLLLQHIQLSACAGVRVEHLHLLVQSPLLRVELHLLRLQRRHLRLQLLHGGALDGFLQLSLLEEEKQVNRSDSGSCSNSELLKHLRLWSARCPARAGGPPTLPASAAQHERSAVPAASWPAGHALTPLSSPNLSFCPSSHPPTAASAALFAAAPPAGPEEEDKDITGANI